MSACRLVATIVSSVRGFSTMRMVIASTSILSHATSGKSCATSAAISSQNTMPCRCALDFVTTVSSLRGPRSGEREGVAHDALDPGAGEDRDLGRHLARQADMGAPALPRIFALGILAHDDPVEIRRRDVAERAA